jgi:hypothetical protein
LAHRFHLLSLTKLIFESAALCDVAKDADDLTGRTLAITHQSSTCLKPDPVSVFMGYAVCNGLNLGHTGYQGLQPCCDRGLIVGVDGLNGASAN